MDESQEKNTIKTLNRIQRRVIGTLVEKGLTTPDQYPLTLKSLTTGCNQKSNRSPITNYSEDAILEALEELRTLGLIGEIHTDGGRAPRYRHYMRKRYTFTEPQLAVVTELLLRGRQQMGELRARASRMVPIEGQGQLRTELASLIEQGFAQASGSLERRGIEVDHGFYAENENKSLGLAAEVAGAPSTPAPPEAVHAVPSVARPDSDTASEAVEELRMLVEELTMQHDQLANRVSELASELERIARQAGIQT